MFVSEYQRSKRGAGDLFYVRVTVDRQAENRDELSFKGKAFFFISVPYTGNSMAFSAGDILRVDNTVFNGVPGLWRAWAVDQEGRELTCGIIPSKQRYIIDFSVSREPRVSFWNLSPWSVGRWKFLRLSSFL